MKKTPKRGEVDEIKVLEDRLERLRAYVRDRAQRATKGKRKQK